MTVRHDDDGGVVLAVLVMKMMIKMTMASCMAAIMMEWWGISPFVTPLPY